MIKCINMFHKRPESGDWDVFVLFAASLVVKSVFFHWSVFHSVLISSLFHNTPDFLLFWGAKFAPAVFIASFVFISRRQWWTVAVSIFLDLWILSNLFYFKANGLLLTFNAITMAGNLSGFLDSVLTYIDFYVIMVPIITIVYTFFLVMRRGGANRLMPSAFVGCLLSVFVLTGGFRIIQSTTLILQDKDDRFGYNYECWWHYLPFGDFFASLGSSFWADVNADVFSARYVDNHSVLSYLPVVFIYNSLVEKGEKIELSDADRCLLDSCLQKHVPMTNPVTSNIIVILVESLESWPLDDVCGISYMPTLKEITESEHTLYCNKVVSQVRHGRSADGQMTLLTGLLPISSGAACMLYGQNRYPSFAHFFENSFMINPAPRVWNQTMVTKSYGINRLIEPHNTEKWRDKDVFEELTRMILSDTSFCAVAITLDSHPPFYGGWDDPVFVKKDMPGKMGAYLSCLYHTDESLGVFFQKFKDSPISKNTTLVITGDHTVFQDSNENIEMNKYAVENDICFCAGHTYVPFVVYSPHISGNIRFTEVCYQMDIYPTIMGLIGETDYSWQGFGINLLDKNSRRVHNEEDAYKMSDLMIRTDYFKDKL